MGIFMVKEPALYVFYGIACTGKSTRALQFAYEHAIRTIIHTDYVREVQRACMRQSERSPLMKVTHNAWELFGDPSTENIIKGFTQHVDAVTPALLAVAQKLAQDGFNAIVEGVHCYGEVLDQLAQVNGLIVLPRLLIATSETRLIASMHHKEKERSPTGEAKAWKSHVKILLVIQDFLLQEAIQRGIPIIE